MKIQEILLKPNLIFDRIYNERDTERLLTMLRLRDPTFENWKYGVDTFLMYGYSDFEVLGIFDKFCQANKYDRNKMITFIRNEINYISRGTGQKFSEKSFSVPSPNLKPFNKGIDIINHFFANTLAVLPFIDVPKDYREAAHFYYRHGFIPLPKHSVDKHPSVYYASHGVSYRNQRYLEEQIDCWDWTHGICLLGDSSFCYLDLDNHIGKDNGVQWLDRQLLRGRHYERTKSGGYHIYGQGNLNTISSIEGVEIRGNSALIVAYPTEGYQVCQFV